MAENVLTPEERHGLEKRRLSDEAAKNRIRAITAEAERDELKRQLALRDAGAGTVAPPASSATGGNGKGSGEPEAGSPAAAAGASEAKLAVLAALSEIRFAPGRTAAEVLPALVPLVEIADGKATIEGEPVTAELLAALLPSETIAAKSGGGSGGRAPAPAGGGGGKEDPVTKNFSQAEWDKLTPEQRKDLQRRRTAAAGARVI